MVRVRYPHELGRAGELTAAARLAIVVAVATVTVVLAVVVVALDAGGTAPGGFGTGHRLDGILAAASNDDRGDSTGLGDPDPVNAVTDAQRVPSGPTCDLAVSSQRELDRVFATARVDQVICYRLPSGPGGATSSDLRRAARPGAGTPRQINCTSRVAEASALSSALGAASAGSRICVTGDLGSTRLTVRTGGTAQAPVTVVGNGTTRTKGITVEANHVVVDGFQVVGAQAPGISIKGDDITVRNNTVDHPTGGDADGLRFWGTNLRIVHNTITNVNPGGGGAHADCMQTFATDSDSPASRHVLIDGNRCDKIDNQCLIAEGPNSSAGDGSGQGKSSDIVFSNNYCNVGAAQATEIDDVTGVKVIRNEITGTPDKAFSFQNRSTGALVQENKIAEGIGYQVGMDSSSRANYRGPQVGGEP
jgi:hypothetical protein